MGRQAPRYATVMVLMFQEGMAAWSVEHQQGKQTTQRPCANETNVGIYATAFAE